MRSGNSQAGRTVDSGNGASLPAMCQNDHHTSTLDGGHRAITRRTAIGAAGAGGVALLFAGIRGTPAGSCSTRSAPRSPRRPPARAR